VPHDRGAHPADHHANDRVEWFFQMCDEIHWDCADKNTGKPLAA
jgi:hypothetical protein